MKKRKSCFIVKARAEKLLDGVVVPDLEQYGEERSKCAEFFLEKGLKTVVFLCGFWGGADYDVRNGQVVKVRERDVEDENKRCKLELGTMTAESLNHSDTRIWAQRTRIAICHWDSAQLFLHEGLVKRLNEKYEKSAIELDHQQYGEFTLSPITDDEYRKLYAAYPLLVANFFKSLELNLALCEEKELTRKMWFFSRNFSGILQEDQGEYTFMIPEDVASDPESINLKNGLSVCDKSLDEYKIHVVDRKKFNREMEKAYLKVLLGEKRENWYLEARS